jgi:hypothetical protein
MKKTIHLGNWTEERLDVLLAESSSIHDPGERVGFLSTHFLNTRYQELTLRGDRLTPEIFVLNLEEVDCFTFIECIEAMRRSRSFDAFMASLMNVRYRSGSVSFENRNHFFTDWKECNVDYIVDVTGFISGGKSKEISKRLNQKDDGTLFVQGIPRRFRKVTYLPAADIDDRVTENLKTGDYVGIYSEKEGLDISHAGILAKEQNTIILRHASSLQEHRKVIDENLKNYLKGKPGIIVLRPKD